MSLDVVQTVCELVAVPSVNPMGRDCSGPEFFEYRLTDYLQRLFDSLGVPWQRQTIQPLRDNIVARIDADADAARRPVILLEAHQDTVPVDGMTISPWEPSVRDGRIYGRGACDIKGGMGAMLAAFARLAEERPRGMPTLIMACTVNEEHGFSGASELYQLWRGSNPIIPRRPDAAIVAEPTCLDVVVAHKGCVRWRCRAHGRATHSSQPHMGDNAIYRMARLLPKLEQYAGEVGELVPVHRLCGKATLSVGTIRGGLSVNTVPDACAIEIDRRLLPGEEPLAAFEQVLAWLAKHAASDRLEHEPPYLQSPALSDEHNGELAERFLEVVRGVLGRGEIVGVPFGTDASKIAATGVPSIVFGPGSIDQAHTADEWLEIEQLKQAERVLFEFLRSPPP